MVLARLQYRRWSHLMLHGDLVCSYWSLLPQRSHRYLVDGSGHGGVHGDVAGNTVNAAFVVVDSMDPIRDN